VGPVEEAAMCGFTTFRAGFAPVLLSTPQMTSIRSCLLRGAASCFVQTGKGTTIFTGNPLTRHTMFSADGQRFLHPVAAEQKSAEPLTLIENWQAGLKK
jgi:hypothetical protein